MRFSWASAGALVIAVTRCCHAAPSCDAAELDEEDASVLLQEPPRVAPPRPASEDGAVLEATIGLAGATANAAAGMALLEEAGASNRSFAGGNISQSSDEAQVDAADRGAAAADAAKQQVSVTLPGLGVVVVVCGITVVLAFFFVPADDEVQALKRHQWAAAAQNAEVARQMTASQAAERIREAAAAVQAPEVGYWASSSSKHAVANLQAQASASAQAAEDRAAQLLAENRARQQADIQQAMVAQQRAAEHAAYVEASMAAQRAAQAQHVAPSAGALQQSPAWGVRQFGSALRWEAEETARRESQEAAAPVGQHFQVTYDAAPTGEIGLCLFEDQHMVGIHKLCVEVPSKEAEERGWRGGDVIQKVNGVNITSKVQFSSEWRQAKDICQATKSPIVIDIWRPAQKTPTSSQTIQQQPELAVLGAALQAAVSPVTASFPISEFRIPDTAPVQLPPATSSGPPSAAAAGYSQYQLPSYPAATTVTAKASLPAAKMVAAKAKPCAPGG